MESRDYSWLFVRAFGVYFAYSAVSYLVSIGGNASTLIMWYLMDSGVATENDWQDRMTVSAWRSIWMLLIGFTYTAALAYYCLFRGAFVNRLLTSRLSPTEQ
jgi:hypothetical protein